jgi:aryl-alcohol dehydrogenase-like predicted oxidoreductase
MDSNYPQTLGKTGIQISPLGIGAWAWGDRMFWGYGGDYKDADIQTAYDAGLEAGINFYDTAEVYGSGRSEKLLGEFYRSRPAAENGLPVVIATKFMPLPWRLGRRSFLRALRGSLNRLEMERVDLYQVHFPLLPFPVETWANAMADAVQAGLVRAVGVSNYNEEQMRRTYTVLAERGVVLASNQVEYSLYSRKVEKNNLLRACQDLGITLIAYSPLAMGLLTGKYTPNNPPPGMRGRRYGKRVLQNLQPLLRLMHEIGRLHNGKTPAQVALNWLICKGTVPIPGAKNARQVQENCGALGWRLSDEEVTALDKAAG